MNIKERFEYLKNRFEILINPKFKANRVYKSVFKKNANFDAPRDLIEKILWLQLYSDTSLWSFCADKYLVRQYVENRVGYAILNKLYGKWTCTDDIDWASLPSSFVLKTNNGCGTVIIIRDKDKMNKDEVVQNLNTWMHDKYGWSNYQLHYTRIKPCIIAEKLLTQDETMNRVSPNSLVDYKVWCFGGVPECILVVYDRSNKGHLLDMYNTNWERIPNSLKKNESYGVRSEVFPKPKCLEKMLEIASVLSNPFPEVRVDFYVIEEKPIIGELTFTSGFGNYTDEFYDYLGTKVDLTGVKKKRIANRW